MGNEILRHFVATLAFRGSVAFQNAPSSFATFEAGKEIRSPVEILNHMTNVLTYILQSFGDKQATFEEIKSWDEEVERFYHTLEQIDKDLQEEKQPTTLSIEKMLQGPLSDAMMHVGQLLTLRRLAGCSVERVSYIKAEVKAGHIRPLKK
ncbi:hypothetical protein [Metabacillus iocasae]|uniref:DinB family protein n=1 Tax=Priestia iocasae TaxID=2291674 RepID=A0ABS2QWM4_9BACI|nr:hypothetical protein [Metabacillus iocasae]MBM7703886.1 hypothetical protein [Metabacillus iocasae]